MGDDGGMLLIEQARKRGRPLVLAHRGASLVAAENTLGAFHAARRMGADGVELDVMRCGSGEVVVFHDEDTIRLCGAPGVVRTLPLEALRARWVAGHACVPTLAEALETIGPEMLVNVELKSPGGSRVLRDDGLAALVAALVARHGATARVVASSFDPLLLARFRRLAPGVATGLLFWKGQARPLREAWAAPLVGVEAVHPEARLLSPERMARWLRRGYAVATWTIDDPDKARRAAGLGVHAIITNDPARVLGALNG